MTKEQADVKKLEMKKYKIEILNSIYTFNSWWNTAERMIGDIEDRTEKLFLKYSPERQRYENTK